MTVDNTAVLFAYNILILSERRSSTVTGFTSCFYCCVCLSTLYATVADTAGRPRSFHLHSPTHVPPTSPTPYICFFSPIFYTSHPLCCPIAFPPNSLVFSNITNPTMSSTNPSYVDDGRDFTRRIPPTSPPANVTHWLHNTYLSSETSSVYTGSYIDDGLDLLPTNAADNTPGFGPINSHFYKHKKRRDKHDRAWNPNIARAISGDIHASLAKLERIAGVEVKRAALTLKEEKRRNERKRGVVSVPAPLKWGTFVIKDGEGRVVVVDERGEYDSGAVRKDNSKEREKRWVEAARSASPPAVFHLPHVGEAPKEKRTREGHGVKERRSETRRDSKVETSRTSKDKRKPRALTPTPGSAYDSDNPVKPSAVSPTDFFMTGGLSGWPSPSKPSRAPSPEPPSRTVPHAITWDTSTSPYTYDSCSKPASKSRSGSHSAQTLPHGWPSRPASTTRSACSSTFTYLKPSSTKRRFRRSSHAQSEQGSRHGHDGQEVVSDYQPPDIIEVTYDETPPGEVSFSQAGLHSDKAPSAQIWSAAAGEGKSKGSDLGWSGSAKGSVWAGDEVRSKSRSARNWSNSSGRSNDPNDEWDGFERPKTTSEASVAGGSERSWPASQHSIHTVQTHRTQRRHTSRRSSRHNPVAWPAASQDGSAVQSEQIWPASAHGSKHSQKSWTKSKHGSDESSPTKYQNGFDEDNATYLNEMWDGIPVRVASPHKSVAGWDQRT
jgi:hypothetical protein